MRWGTAGRRVEVGVGLCGMKRDMDRTNRKLESSSGMSIHANLRSCSALCTTSAAQRISLVLGAGPTYEKNDRIEELFRDRK